eukprot:Amastigsp_a676325_859.p5 type:complete len:114 gc:universal Amastigsp_a676325_859:494-153(-)
MHSSASLSSCVNVTAWRLTTGQTGRSFEQGQCVWQYEMPMRSGLGNTSTGRFVWSRVFFHLPLFLMPHLLPYMSTPRMSRSRSPSCVALIEITTMPMRNTMNNRRKNTSVQCG